MARISKSTKSLMVDELLRHGKFDENIEAKYQAMLKVGDEIHRAIFGKYLPAIKKLPANMFNYTINLTLEDIPSPDNRFRFRVELSDYRVATTRGGVMDADFHKMTKDHELIKKYLKAKQALQDEKVKRQAVKEQAEAVLNSVGTFKKLWEVWADARPLLEKFDKATTENLPRVISNVATLNTIFGLPPTGEK